MFVIVVMEHVIQGPYQSGYGVSRGTGFFAPDGTVITSSHVIYPVRANSITYLKEAPVPYEWSAAGIVSHMETLKDGTQVFEVWMGREAEPGHSGSPVLNTSDQVVGLFNWLSRDDPKMGTAISSAALDPVCH